MADVTVSTVGLCAGCRHAEVVRSSRDSTFYLCRLSLSDDRFQKYPTLPVIACDGYSPLESVSNGVEHT